ncbi:MAG: hypothetical protein ACPLX7_07455 [Candidatus Kapaibacteriota bacterium]|jgi:hypothetical protein
MKEFSPEDITKFLEVAPEVSSNCSTWKLFDPETRNFLFLSVYTNIDFNGTKNTLVSVQTNFGYFELHNFNSVYFLEPNEIAFIQFDSEIINCLVVGKNCTCSLFSNIDRKLVRSKIAELDPAFLLSALQLALLEEILP